MEVFPAHAGVIPTVLSGNLCHIGFSRTRGGDPLAREGGGGQF